MATADSVKAKLQGLIAKANEATGNTDADLTTAVNALVAGFGQGGGGLEYVEGEVAAGTTWSTVVNHNTGWSKYLYIAYVTSPPTEDEAAYSDIAYMVAMRLYGSVTRAVGMICGINYSTGGVQNRRGESAAGIKDPTMQILLSGGAAYNFYNNGEPIRWVVINMEGRYL